MKPDKTPGSGADRTKVLSVRLTDEEFQALTERATEVGVGPSTLARTYVRQAVGNASAYAPRRRTPRDAARDSALEQHLEALLAADLVPRIEALEKWVKAR